MSPIRVEVWVGCDTCDLEIGPTLTETTARSFAKAARWMSFRAVGTYETAERWRCSKCLGRPPLV